MEEEHRLISQRKQKLQELRKNNIEPYPYKFDKRNNAKEILENFKKLKKEEKSKEKVSIAGRIMSLRIMGKVSFGHMQDSTEKIQFYVKEEELGREKYKIFTKFDIGDFIGINGNIFRTKRGEISIWVKKLELLSKSLRPLPEKWHGLKDMEIRYRKRYLDLLMNQEVKDVFLKRSEIIKAVREFLDSKGFKEVEAPLLQQLYGGANARPFKTKINAYDMNMYLSISPELYLKRLIIGGFEKVYTICKNFRNEGVDKTHNPEFMMMEFYQSYVDYHEMMRLTEDVFAHVAHKIYGKLKIPYQGKEIDFSTPWKRLSIKEALLQHAQIDVDKKSDEELQHLLDQHKIEYRTFARDQAVILLLEALVEEKLIQPI